ncbi:MAG: hypothetical protein E7572_07295 [Ruminococcaceae bacterium]|nr:hypothetical protein [Oscillospiraceae bacterium]
MGDITYSIDDFVAAHATAFGSPVSQDIVTAALNKAGKSRYTKDEAQKIVQEFSAAEVNQTKSTTPLVIAAAAKPTATIFSAASPAPAPVQVSKDKDVK